ncbi:hypothetical protein Q7F20_00520 [Curtobacterium sp. A7_M15]|uniref:hypothetical protein n=1 Tax=Curtobacterium sp. A7_M15 TaxID=3065241 RepID=UPI002737FADF|nr:hypothetical protein [Curtobacterium sp. A7_M15]MDP4331848.1 hypothetical protein [Curtobacterium sp. A7_M15]
MVRRTGLVAGIAVVVALVLGGCVATQGADADLAIEAYVEPGDGAAATVSDASRRASTVGIDGVTVTDDGAGLNELPGGVAALARSARAGGAAPELLVSNFSESIGDFSPEVGTALLSDPSNRSRVAERLADLASAAHVRGVQIDLESLRSRDRAGLVAFASRSRTPCTTASVRTPRCRWRSWPRRTSGATARPGTTSARSPTTSTASS